MMSLVRLRALPDLTFDGSTHVVGATVDDNGQLLGGVDTGSGSVQRKLSNADTDTVDAEVAQTQDTRTVRDDTDLRVGVGPVRQHGLDRLSLLNRNVQGLRAGEEGRVLRYVSFLLCDTEDQKTLLAEACDVPEGRHLRWWACRQAA